jgi:hypothetical protein
MSKKHTYDYVKSYFENEGYKLTSNKYKSNKQKLESICPVGHCYVASFTSFKQGKRCGKCSPTKKLEYEDVKLFIEGVGYKLLSDTYKNNRTKLIMECPDGHIFKVRFNHFKDHEVRCSHCQESKGEQKIRKWLGNNSIKYIQQYRFKDCKNKSPLPFDFAIMDDEDNLLCLIEYDGELHYKPSRRHGSEEALERRKKNDEIKNTYCENNSIYLIRVSYWELKNIEKILSEELLKLNILEYMEADENHASFSF